MNILKGHFLCTILVMTIITIPTPTAQAAGKTKKDTAQHPPAKFDPESYWAQCTKVRKAVTCEKLLDYNKNIEDSKKQSRPSGS